MAHQPTPSALAAAMPAPPTAADIADIAAASTRAVMAHQPRFAFDNDQIVAIITAATVAGYVVLYEGYRRMAIAATTGITVALCSIPPLPPTASIPPLPPTASIPPLPPTASTPTVATPDQGSAPTVPPLPPPAAIPPPIAVDAIQPPDSNPPPAHMSTRRTTTTHNVLPTSTLTTKQRATLKKLSGMGIGTPTQVLVETISNLLTPPPSPTDSSHESGSNFPT